MNRSPQALADPTGSYVANIISNSKGGRNEVQIFNISGSSSSQIQASVAVKFELTALECPIDAMWFTPSLSNSNPKAPKRKQGTTDLDQEVTFTQPQLAVLLQTNEIILMLPTHSTITKRINPEPKIIRFLGISNSMHIWAIADTPKLVELSLETGMVSRSNKYKEDDSVYIGSVVFSKNSKLAPLVLIGATQIYSVDALKVRVPVLQKSSLPNNDPAKIKHVRMSITNPKICYIASENSSQVYSYNTEDMTLRSTFEASGNVLDLNVIPTGGQELVAATTANGVDTFQPHSDQKCGTIKSGGRPLTGIFINIASQRLVGVFHDVNEPLFELIDCTLPPAGDIEIKVSLQKIDAEKTSNAGHQIQLPATCTIINESPEVILRQLVDLLTIEGVRSDEVITLCSQNDDPATIKETVMLISLCENSKELVDLLISSIGPAVLADAADTTSLSIWLKWLLLLHGGTIAREPNHNEQLKQLQTGLEKGVALLPHMLALQGRLKLLKAQAEFRDKMASLALNEESEEQEVPGAQEPAQTVAYANGENDDDDVFEIGDADIDEEEDIELQV